MTERDPETGEVVVLTGDGFLVLERVELDGGGRTAPADAVATTRTRLGAPDDSYR
jgi:hypothetical protein